jgi:hypothetical protein
MVDLTLNPFFFSTEHTKIPKNQRISKIEEKPQTRNPHHISNDAHEREHKTEERSSSRLLYNAFFFIDRRAFAAFFSTKKQTKPKDEWIDAMERKKKIHFGTAQSQPQMLFSNASKYFGFSLFNFEK